MAPDQNGESRACGTAVVSDRGSNLVGSQRRRYGRCQLAGEQFGGVAQAHVARRKASGRSRPRMISCFVRGIITVVGTLIRGDGLVLGRFLPEPWPSSPAPPKKKTNVKLQAHRSQEAA